MPAIENDTHRVPRPLIDALLQRGTFGRPDRSEVIETHISWVILTDTLAYKIKKPVKPGFLDFSTLELRRRACMEELRVNRRLMPEYYLDVIAIYGSVEEPVLEPDGPIVEYAVLMRRFPPGAVLSEATAPQIADHELDALAELIGQFHRGLPPAPAGDPRNTPEKIREPVDSSLAQLRELLRHDSDRSLLQPVHHFIDQEFERTTALMRQRQAAGFIRECHGDLHLGNLARIGGRIVPFDALEFDPALRWIDVLNEVAFLVMDLEMHGKHHAGFRFLNRYLDLTGDHAGLPVVPFYLAYRAIVRAKVAALSPDRCPAERQLSIQRLLQYAADPRTGSGPLLVLMCGISGSGKSYLATRLALALPAIHVRSDVERKRLFGLDARARTASGVAQGIYAPGASARTYAQLNELAAAVIESRLPVIVDATNLRHEQREPFLQLARETGCPSAILVCHCDPALIDSRVKQRQNDAHDPSEASQTVVRRQRPGFEPPDAAAATRVIEIDTGQPQSLDELAVRLRALLPRPTP